MKQIFSASFLCVSLFAVLAGCAGSKNGSASNNDSLKMNVEEKPDVINYSSLKQQEVPDMAGRADKGRGPLTGLVGGAVSLATNAVKQMIAKDKKKYTAAYSYGLTDLYFYDQLSLDGPFDPLGLQFSGFKMVRTFENNGKTDTALVAEFELDAANPYEILNNSIFRLKLKSLTLNYAKAKVPGNNNYLNMDFEISFNSSYVNNQGALFKNMELGKFYFFLRKAPLDKNDPGYADYYKNLAGKKLDGQSFIVPRSFGYHITGANNAQPSYSQGAYTITVNVKESSKNTFVNQLIIDNSSQLVDALGGAIKKKLD
ncbi:MAG: hypothetical protein QM687_09875 [Ferruginibacter sp.]